MQYNKRNCPAIVGMYYHVDGVTSPTAISRLTGLKVSSVWQILNRKYGVGTPREKRGESFYTDVERDYLAGMNTYDMASKYGVDHSTISKWMKRRGHARGKGNGFISDEMRERNEAERIRACAEKAEREKIRERHRAEREAAKQAEIERRADERAAEYAKDKVCASCGSVFHSEYKTQRYCNDTCSRREKRHRDASSGKTKLVSYGNHRKRARKLGVPYEPGITLKKLMERDGNVCQICGEPCDVNDRRYGSSGPLYPSIDHIKPMARGGSHTWDNVQLAHTICNSCKRDIYDAEEHTARD